MAIRLLSAGLAVMVGPDAVAVRRAEVAGEPLSLDGGLELGDSAFEFLLFGGGDVVVASAAAARWHGEFQFEKELFHLGVL